MPAPANKPPLTVFIVGRAGRDLFSDLRVQLNLPRYLGGWGPIGFLVDGEKHTIHLRNDVHRGHAGACALLVVHVATGCDADSRIAVLHARREGLHRFAVLINTYERPERGDAVERDVRLLLESFDLDANVVTVVRAPLYRYAKEQSEATAAGVRELVAALDDLPAFAEPSPLRAVPPTFAREAALLDAVLPLYAPVTMLGAHTRRLADHPGPGGSRLDGPMYREHGERGPSCPQHHRPMPAALQIDARDFQHEAPANHRLFVAYACRVRGCDVRRVRHFSDPRPERQDPTPPASAAKPRERFTMLVPEGRCWSLPSARLLVAEHRDTAARLHTLTGADPVATYVRISMCMGAGLPIHYLGGYHNTRLTTPTPHCRICGEPCVVVATFSAGMNADNTLWACREHPNESIYLLHP